LDNLHKVALVSAKLPQHNHQLLVVSLEQQNQLFLLEQDRLLEHPQHLLLLPQLSAKLQHQALDLVQLQEQLRRLV
jgi:hypothetical protein